MNTYLSPTYKWLIGGFTVLLIGLGIWAGVIVSGLNKKGATSSTATSNVPSTLSETPASATTETPAATTVDTTPKATTSTKSTSSTSVAPVKQNQESTLAASVTTTNMNGQMTIMVVANQSIVVGIDSIGSSFQASDFTMVKTLTATPGDHTVIVRTQGGQETRFSVAGSSMVTSAASQS